MVFSSFLAVLLGLPLLANAFHNVTYNDNDPALIYRPANAWLDWPPAGCLSWPGGQYTQNAAASITFNFYGVALYVYGLFDDGTNPIYTITIDNGSPVEQGRGINANPQSCAPIYSKTGLTAANHTVVFQMTNTRPGDVKDLSFQGFIVTVPDTGDATSTSEDSTKKPNIIVIAGAGGGGVVVLIIIAVGIFFCCRARKNKNKVSNHQMVGSAVPLVVQYPPPTMADPSIPAPTPFILPPSREASPYHPPPASPWSPAPSSDNNPYYPGPTQGSMQAPSHVTYAGSSHYTSSSPSNDGYNRPYNVPGTPVANPHQSYYQPAPSSQGPNGAKQDPFAQMIGGHATQQQYNQGHAEYPPQQQQQQQQQQYSNHPWNAPTSPPPPTELSYLSSDHASSSIAKPIAKQDSQHKYGKGAVDHNAAPVVRNENADIHKLGPKRESQGGEAPPPEYVPYS